MIQRSREINLCAVYHRADGLSKCFARLLKTADLFCLCSLFSNTLCTS